MARARVSRRRVSSRCAVHALEPRTLLSAGQLDPTFDGDGIALRPEAYLNDQTTAAAAQPDGKVVVAGTHVAEPEPSDDAYQFGVARYNADGSLDTSFGIGGRVATDVTGGWDFATAVAPLPDGDVVVAGYGNGELAVARYNPDGTPDTAFGGDGTVEFNAAGRHTTIFAAAAQPDGKILVAGEAGGDSAESYDIVVVRLLRDGTPDPTFSGDGVALLDAGGFDWAHDLLLRPDGRIVLVGQSSANDRSDIIAARLNGDGTPDAFFGASGIAVLALPDQHPRVIDAALQGDKIVVALDAPSGWLTRLNPDGSLDTTFAAGGRVTVPPAAGVVGIEVLGDGRIDVGLGAPPGPAPQGGVSVTRYTADGQLDTTFGSAGLAVLRYPRVAAAGDVVIQPGGRILVAATYDSTDFAVAAFRADGTTDTGYGTNGLGSAKAALPESFGVFYDVAVLAGGKVLAVGKASDALGNIDVYVARYTADGSLDPSFGGGDGQVFADFGGAEAALRLAVRPDGKFLVYGSLLARFNPDGSLDRTFAGGTGYLAFPPAPDSFFRQDGLALQADNKILIARAGGVERYTADGSLDPTLGTGGRMADFSDLETLEHFDAVDVAVQPGGNIIVAGEASQSDEVYDSDGEDVVVLRLTSDGRVDRSFAPGRGYAWESEDYGDRANRLAVGPDGQIAVAASEDDDDANVLFVDPDGNHAQVVTLDEWWNGYPRDVAFAPDGKVVAAGFQYNWEYDTQAVRVARFNTDRTLDTTFGGLEGGARVDVAPGRSDNAFGVAVAPDGDVIVAGGAASFPMVLRFDGEPSRGILLAPDGTLTIVGGDDADQISVQFSDHDVVARLNGTMRTWPLDQVRYVVLHGEGGDDTISAAAVPADRPLIVYGGDGNDRIAAARVPGALPWTLPPRIDGGGGNDTITGGPTADLLLGGDGDDTLDGAGGADSLEGGPGSDTADYSARTADLSITLDYNKNDGEAGENDALWSIEKVLGGAGNDRMSGDDTYGPYAFFGNGGNDTLSGNDAANALWGGAGADLLEGHGGNDYLAGGDGNDVLRGNDADDTLDGGPGNDTLAGGAGTDAADYSARTSRLTVTLNNKPDDGGRGERDNVMDDVEDVIGGSGDDRISGSAANNRLWGGAGRDTLSGGGGKDQLRGQAGNDTLIARGDNAIDFLDGGSGNDRDIKDSADFAQFVEQLLA